MTAPASQRHDALAAISQHRDVLEASHRHVLRLMADVEAEIAGGTPVAEVVIEARDELVQAGESNLAEVLARVVAIGTVTTYAHAYLPLSLTLCPSCAARSANPLGDVVEGEYAGRCEGAWCMEERVKGEARR